MIQQGVGNGYAASGGPAQDSALVETMPALTPPPGLTSFKVFVVMAVENEAGSAPMTVSRPA